MLLEVINNIEGPGKNGWQTMKKIFVVFLSVSALLGGLIIANSSRAEEATQDQYCAPGDESSYEMLGAAGIVRSQTFEPAKNRLTEIDIKIGGLNLNGGTPITLTLYGPGFDGPEIASKTIMPTVGVPSVRSWTFSSPVTLTPGTVYKFILSTTGPGSVYWYYGAGDQTCDGNNRTYAFRDSTHMTWDWNYKTLGYNVSTPAGDSTPSDSGTTGSTGSGETLGTATFDIVKPTNLTATYSDTTGSVGVKLAWKASTTADITGYKIFRSESADKDFKKITETKKDKVEYLDQDIVASKTYYYQVRAYKGSEQSYSSNTANVTIPADAPPAKPKGLTIVGTTSDTISVKWEANTEANLAGYTITLLKGEEKIQSQDLKKEETTFQFKDVEASTSYVIELVAKNDKSKSSAPASVIAETPTKTFLASFFTPLTITLFSLAIVLTGVLVYLIIRRGKKAKANKTMINS